MSRKHALKLKKERVRLGVLEERLERLHRQGADEAFLDLAQGRARDLSPAAAELYGQVVDRSLRRALAGANLQQAERLLARIGREARKRPLAALAETVLHIAEGRLDEARARLAALRVAPGVQPWPPGLVEGLAALSAAGSTGPPEASIQRFHQAHAAVQEQGFRLGSAEARELRQAAGELRSVLPADPALKRLLESAEEHLRLLGELEALEKSLRRRKGAGLVPFFLERVKVLSRSLLTSLRDSPPAALLRPLQHALRLRWRTLLTLASERGGAGAWAELHTALPTLFSLDLEFAGGAESFRIWTAIRELREAGDHRRLARLLGSLSSAEPAPERVALLWSLELWAWERAARDEDDIMAVVEPADRAALVRLGRMAGDLAGRLPSEQRAEVARFLRARLFDLCERQFFCAHSMEAAGSLLRQLPDDPGLLAVALTGAACAKDGRAQGLFASRIAARGEARAIDRETVLRLLSQIVQEKAETVVRVLPSLRLLLGEETWPQALDIVLRSLTGFVCDVLDGFYDETDLQEVRKELDSHRSILAERPEFAALEAAIDCIRRDGGGVQALKKLLGRSPELETALTALRVLRAASGLWAPPAVDRALDLAREEALSRLDLRWRLWRPLLPALVLGASRSQVKRLRDRLNRWLRSEGLSEEDRQALSAALAGIADLQRMDKIFQWGAPKEPARPRRKRRREPDGEQLSFDLF